MEENKIFDSLVESIGQLVEMQDSANDYYSAGLYRAMFRNETDLNKLDYNYADHILEYAEFGCQNAIEDYRNYLLYVKKLYPLCRFARRRIADDETAEGCHRSHL